MRCSRVPDPGGGAGGDGDLDGVAAGEVGVVGGEQQGVGAGGAEGGGGVDGVGVGEGGDAGSAGLGPGGGHARGGFAVVGDGGVQGGALGQGDALVGAGVDHGRLVGGASATGLEGAEVWRAAGIGRRGHVQDGLAVPLVRSGPSIDRGASRLQGVVRVQERVREQRRRLVDHALLEVGAVAPEQVVGGRRAATDPAEGAGRDAREDVVQHDAVGAADHPVAVAAEGVVGDVHALGERGAAEILVRLLVRQAPDRGSTVAVEHIPLDPHHTAGRAVGVDQLDAVCVVAEEPVADERDLHSWADVGVHPELHPVALICLDGAVAHGQRYATVEVEAVVGVVVEEVVGHRPAGVVAVVDAVHVAGQPAV